MNAPAVLIRFELEAAPRVIVDALHESELERLHFWFESHRLYLELIQRAWQLTDEEPAA